MGCESEGGPHIEPAGRPVVLASQPVGLGQSAHPAFAVSSDLILMGCVLLRRVSEGSPVWSAADGPAGLRLCGEADHQCCAAGLQRRSGGGPPNTQNLTSGVALSLSISLSLALSPFLAVSLFLSPSPHGSLISLRTTRTLHGPPRHRLRLRADIFWEDVHHGG